MQTEGDKHLKPQSSEDSSSIVWQNGKSSLEMICKPNIESDNFISGPLLLISQDILQVKAENQNFNITVTLQFKSHKLT